MPARQLKLSRTDRMECVRAETRAGISKANKVRDDVLSPKQQQQQAKEDDDDAENPAMALPRKEEGPSTTKNPKIEWGYAQPWADTWDRSTPLACPLKLPWQDHCVCHNCNSPSPWGAGLVQPRGSFAGSGVWNPKELWRPNKIAADLPSAKPAGGLDEEKNRSSSVVKNEVIRPGLKEAIKPGLTEAMRHAPTAYNSAESLPELARVDTNPSPTAQKAKREEERTAATGKDAPPPTDPSSKEGLLAASGKDEEKQRRERRKEVLKKMAKENMEWMNSSPIFEYQSIRRSDLPKLKDELKESNEKLAIVKVVMELDQAGLTNLLNTLPSRKEKTCTPQDAKPENINKDVAVPASETDSQAPAPQTGTDSPQQSKEQVETKGKDSLSALIARWDREKEARKAEAAAKRAPPCGITEKLLLAFSILDLTVRLILLATLWCCSTRWSSTGGGGPGLIQVTIAYFTPPAMLVGLWRTAIAHFMIGEGGAESDRILRRVEQTDMAALGVAVALMVSLAVHVVLSVVWSCEGV